MFDLKPKQHWRRKDGSKTVRITTITPTGKYDYKVKWVEVGGNNSHGFIYADNLIKRYDLVKDS